MNYNDSILENKEFKFVKQLLYNIAIGIVVILAICLVFVYAFQFKPYKVLTGSMHPSIKVGDMVVVHKSNEYKVGDVLKFDQTETAQLPTVHRLLAIKDGKYICHGDNVAYSFSTNESWKEEADALSNMTLAEIQRGSHNYQYVDAEDIEGKVVTTLANYGTYLDFIAQHKMLFITIILGLWCFTFVVQNEIEIRQSTRLAR